MKRIQKYDDKKNKKYLDNSAQCELNKKQKTAKKEIDVYEDNKDLII